MCCRICIYIMYGLVRFEFTILFLSTTISGKFFDPCFKEDIRCLSTATENFLEKTCNGIPKFDIKPIDPLIIPELDIVVDDEMGILFKFTNVTVTGLKNLQILDFKMDTDKKSVVLKTKTTLNIVSDLTIKLTEKRKSFNGRYTALVTVLSTSIYGYSLLKKGDDEWFEVGPEINTCEIIEEPDVPIGHELQNALNNDQDAWQLKSWNEKHKEHLRKEILCTIVKSAYTVVIHNLRAVARILPKGSFFKDIIN